MMKLFKRVTALLLSDVKRVQVLHDFCVHLFKELTQEQQKALLQVLHGIVAANPVLAQAEQAVEFVEQITAPGAKE